MFPLAFTFYMLMPVANMKTRVSIPICGMSCYLLASGTPHYGQSIPRHSLILVRMMIFVLTNKTQCRMLQETTERISAEVFLGLIEAEI